MPERPREIPRQEFTDSGERIVMTAEENQLIQDILSGLICCPECEAMMDGSTYADEDLEYCGVVLWCSKCDYWEW